MRRGRVIRTSYCTPYVNKSREKCGARRSSNDHAFAR
jgi:hypothetical protein